MEPNTPIAPNHESWILPPELFDRLSELYIFQDVEKEAIAEMFAEPIIEKYNPGTVLISEGEAADGKAYIILEGSVDVQIDGKPVGVISKGNIFGEYGIISEENRTATVIARNDLLCLILNQDTIFRLLNEGSAVNDVMVQRIKDNIHNERGGFKDD